MYAAPGIGLAAIQLGEPKRVVTMDLAKKDDPKEPQVFINPEILWTSDEKNVHEEGCLSIPEYYEEVERPAEVKVKYMDLDGKPHEVHATGLLATCLQHEIDHLNGVLFIDHCRSSSAIASSRNSPSRPSARRRTEMPLRLVFMGTPDFAVPTLVELAGAGHEIVAVYTRAPKPAGRGMDLQDTPVAREAKRLGIPVLTPSTLKTQRSAGGIRAHGADAAVVVAYGLILPKPVLDAVPLGCFNLHASLLAALARRRADQSRDHGRRHRDPA